MPNLISRTSPVRRVLVGAAIVAVSTGAAVAAPSAAWAHVNAAATPAGGGATKVTFTFDHGCAGAPTTSLRVQLPEGTSDVAPEDPAGWTSATSPSDLRWTGGSIPDGQRGTFTATMTIPGTAGETVYLPAIQGCPGGVEEAWIDKTPDAGATTAAPRIVLTATVAPTTTTTSTSTNTPLSSTSSSTPSTTAAPATAPVTTTISPAPASTTSTSNVPLLIGAVLVVLALLGAGGYAYSKRSGPSEG